MAESSTRGVSARRAGLSVALAVLSAAAAALVTPACLDQREAPVSDPDVARCTSCHGDASRPGDSVGRSAPPHDLLGQSDPSYPGVGAHALHLNEGPTHAAVACDECHVVPDSVEAPGHADDARPAELTFGVLAREGDREPSYDAAARTCVDSYCHREARPVWSQPRDSAEACGSCHGLPPPLPHPQSERCSACHGEVIDAGRHFLAPEKHVNGRVEYAAGECRLCHGGDENAAPPLDTIGNDAITALGVGAHQAHLAGGDNGRPLACGECHRVPERVEEPTHVDAPPAEVRLTGVALTGDRQAAWDASTATCSESFCHSPSTDSPRRSPVWNEPAVLDCASCHGAPPPVPHPQMTECSVCHETVAATNDAIVDKDRHVDGVLDVMLEQSCSGGCHGGDNPAPPRDVEGNVLTSAAGVGAHQTHVQGTERSRPVPCGECHVVPESVLDAGHVDTDRPAELVFSGVARAHDAAPVYANGTCRSTSCHGAVFPDYPSGGSNTEPDWTRVDGSEAACGTCHGLPPPPPHPLPSPEYPCHVCHFNVADDDVSFVRPDLHVDGKVTLQVED
ncbi:MAG TPA: CxxxxCH/CxxCH domain-containing protein [Polyangiaceae bacterium]